MNPLHDELKNLLDEIMRGRDVLAYSLVKCQRLNLNEGLSPDELESFEALTSRFARLSDVITQKAFRLLDVLDLETQGTVRDRINRAEKKGLIKSADEFIDIRLLRNEIAHEYKAESVYSLFSKVLEWTPPLLQCAGNLEIYAKGRYW